MKKNPARNVHLVKGPTNLLEKINLSIDVVSMINHLYFIETLKSISTVRKTSRMIYNNLRHGILPY